MCVWLTHMNRTPSSSLELMAADVSSLVRIMSEYKKNAGAGDAKTKSDLVTRDFLGSAVIGSKELDLDLEVPSGWERRLDLLSGETCFEKSGSRSDPVHRELHDLNLPPPPPAAASDSSALDLRLLLPPAAPSYDYQSVCTLEKVRSALERAGRESQSKSRQQISDGGGSASPSSSTTSSSMKRRPVAGDQAAERGTDGSDPSAPAGLIAAGCPSCLLYVLISKGNPRCPRCDSHVPAPATAPAPALSKKPRIDLNSL